MTISTRHSVENIIRRANGMSSLPFMGSDYTGQCHVNALWSHRPANKGESG